MYNLQLSPERKLKLCALPTCKGKRYDLVHKFPMNNERAQQWIDIIDLPELRELSIDKVRKRFFICSKHFRPQDYKNCESRSLNTTAYPRLHLKVEEEEAPDQCSSNVNSGVEELSQQEFNYNEQETTIEITTTKSCKLAANETPSERPKDNTSLQYIVCSPVNEIPKVLRNKRESTNQAIAQNQTRSQTAQKPVNIYSSVKHTIRNVNSSTASNEANKFVTLKRNANYSIEPIHRKIQLKESQISQTYSNPSLAQKTGMFCSSLAVIFLFSCMKIFLIEKNIISY